MRKTSLLSVHAPPLPKSISRNDRISIVRFRSNLISSIRYRRMSSDAAVFLHGDLDLWILEAKNLPNMDQASERMRKCLSVFGSCDSGFGSKSKRKARLSARHSIITNTTDAYVSVCLAGATVAQTRIIPNSENPLWDEHYLVPIAHPATKLEFLVKDNDILGAEVIGTVEIPADKILTGNEINCWFPVIRSSGRSSESYPELHITLQFKPAEDNPLYRDGVGTGPDYVGVPNTYFPLRKGNKVTLYQDAHVPDSMLPDISLDGGMVYQNGKCWEDICHAILEAHHLVYVVGWSVYHMVKLVREPTKTLPAGGELCLGDLLKYKSQEGVQVALLIWDDKTSHDKVLLKTEGIMQTHDEETKKFFRNTNVHCVLAPRYASNKLSIFKQQVVGTLFTHHQKCVIVDSQGSGNNRKLTTFMGGLDLCDGRYDTPEHRLFRDLDTIFANDFHNPSLPSYAQSPRQPWHDLHCKIEGPAAYDIFTNFEQRWKKAAKWRQFKLRRVGSWHDDVLLRMDRISWLVTPGPDGDEAVHVSDEDDPENWHVQVFRSIDSGSVEGFPKNLERAAAQSLVCGKNLQVDKSIHTAYVKAIRSAQHFIYIENQYFLGSSFHWPSYKDAGAGNLIPIELALKISSKISAHEPFCVYIVVPMWPEGIPTSSAVQEILFWQGQTMAMMYGIIAETLTKAGLSDQYHPQDYLAFYCLGKREASSTEDTPQSNERTENRILALVQKFRRFMIYVHAKGMIVDDEYVLMGSANINQRSLDGSRDTEIAMGAYQPKYTWAREKSHPHGQVFGYRMSLWAEHLGQMSDVFREPQKQECVKLVNRMAEDNWRAFVDDEVEEMKGHLLMYPVSVGRDGKVSPLSGYETFPDVGGKVLGAANSLPDTLTT